jgi:prophage DNA circulation protein
VTQPLNNDDLIESGDQIADSLTLVEQRIGALMTDVDVDHRALSDLLEELYAAGADVSMLSDVQDLANNLAKSASVANATASAAFEAARLMREQSRLLQQAMEQYRAAVARCDTDFPEIRQLYDEAYTDAESAMLDSEQERMIDFIGDNTMLSYSQASSLTNILRGNILDNDDALWHDLIDWIELVEEHEGY